MAAYRYYRPRYRRWHSGGTVPKPVLIGGAVAVLIAAGGTAHHLGHHHHRHSATSASAPAGSTTPGTNEQLGDSMASGPPWNWPASQVSCLNWLWTRESGWSTSALNPSSDATGIPQLLPSAHAIPAGWGKAAIQIRWGLDYIAATYITPCSAWAHETSDGWY